MNPTRFLMNCNNIPHDCEKIDKKRQNMIWEKHEDHNENIKNKKKTSKETKLIIFLSRLGLFLVFVCL